MESNSFNLFGYVGSPGPIGFCIPLFSSSKANDNKIYFQDVLDENTYIIKGFSPLTRGYDLTDICTVKSSKINNLKKGDKAIFGFQIPRKNSNKFIYIFDNCENLKPFFEFLIRRKLLQNESIIEEVFYFYKIDSAFNDSIFNVDKSYSKIKSVNIKGNSFLVTISNETNDTISSELVLDNVDEESLEALFG